jgi:predicted NAD/FAD-binding protein
MISVRPKRNRGPLVRGEHNEVGSAGKRIAVVGSGITGLSCAWLLSQRHRVTLFEAAPRLGGHGCTVDVPHGSANVAVDMGFIVYNERTYPNLTALFAHLDVPTSPSCMSLGLSLDDGAFEYGGHDVPALFAQWRNVARPRFWNMIAALLRLYRLGRAAAPPDSMTLGAWLDEQRIPRDFQHDHLLPMAAAIWSCPPGAVREQPAVAFLRFCDNHGLLRLSDRPAWRTVAGGARAYISRLRARIAGDVLVDREVVGVSRETDGVIVRLANGRAHAFDEIVLAVHGADALALLADAHPTERAVLGTFRDLPNRAVLHGDASLMPRRRAAWSSWNFIGRAGPGDEPPCVTYWMNRLQGLPGPNLFVTLNPFREPARSLIHAEQLFTHPLFDTPSLVAQKQIWLLQGVRRTWFCGAWMGAGFHEDGLQAGLAVAEALGGVRRPWRVQAESGRIHLPAEMALAP